MFAHKCVRNVFQNSRDCTVNKWALYLLTATFSVAVVKLNGIAVLVHWVVIFNIAQIHVYVKILRGMA